MSAPVVRLDQLPADVLRLVLEALLPRSVRSAAVLCRLGRLVCASRQFGPLVQVIARERFARVCAQRQYYRDAIPEHPTWLGRLHAFLLPSDAVFMGPEGTPGVADTGSEGGRAITSLYISLTAAARQRGLATMYKKVRIPYSRPPVRRFQLQNKWGREIVRVRVHPFATAGLGGRRWLTVECEGSGMPQEDMLSGVVGPRPRTWPTPTPCTFP